MQEILFILQDWMEEKMNQLLDRRLAELGLINKQDNSPKPRQYFQKQVAKMFNISEKYLIELKKQGVVTPRRTDGRKVYYTEEDLQKLISDLQEKNQISILANLDLPKGLTFEQLQEYVSIIKNQMEG